MKLTVLIAEQMYGPTRPVEVVENASVSMIIPALVEELQLPKREASGEWLHYTLRLLPEGDVLSDGTTLAGAGIGNGMTLLLDVSKASQTGNTHNNVLMSMPFTGSSGDSLHSSTTFADADGLSALSVLHQETGQVNKRNWTRRAALSVGFAALGAGIAGYASYRSLRGNISALTSMGMQSAVPVQKTATKATLPTTAQRVMTFTEHQQTVRVVVWSPNGTTLASGADDAQLLLWGTNGVLTRSVVHPAPVRSAAWSPDGTRIVTGSNNQVLFLNISTNTVLNRSVHRHTGVVSGLAWTGHNQNFQVVSAGLDMHAFVWNTMTYRSQLEYTRHTAPIDAVSWAADGQTVATSSHGGAVRIWNAMMGQDVHDLYYIPNIPLRILSFAPTGMLLAVGGDDGLVRLWNGLTCQQVAATNVGQVCADTPQQLRVSQKAIRALAWSPDGRFLATGSDDGELSLWYPAKGQQPLFRMTVQQDVPIYSLTWSPKGDQIAAASGNSVVLWRVM